MKATEAKLLSFLKKSPQFVIPIYQRTYSWKEPQCKQLWNDILRAGSTNDISAHFAGAIVYIENELFHVTTDPPLLVIDGQQRLTTVSLVLEALARALGDAEPVEGFSAKKIRNYYLLNSIEESERRYKLLLTQTDKQTLLDIIEQKPLSNDCSIRLQENMDFFTNKIDRLDGKFDELCQGLAKLMVVDISLSSEHDNPQLIFESMNSTGLALSKADLIRNFLLMGLERMHQTSLYNDYWRPMETAFGQEAYGQHFDGFMRHYLTIKTGVIPNIKQVYDVFKSYARGHKVAIAGVDALVSDIKEFSDYYVAIVLGGETDANLASTFANLRELKAGVTYPLLLELYDDYKHDRLSKEELEKIARMIESYMFRRTVCGIPTQGLNKMFPIISRSRILKKDQYLESIQAYFRLLPSYRRFPSDEEFCDALKQHDLYNFRNCSYWLRRLENHGRKERVSVGEYTVEHIMPQNEALTPEWQEVLGDDWQEVQARYLHTLGNLTLTGYNSEYSDHAFAKKRDMEGGFRDSPLWLNQGLRAVEVWNETAIRERARRLAERACEVWAYPNLASGVLDNYREKVAESDGIYNIYDYQFLEEGGPTRNLFNTLQRQILDLNPCIREVFLKTTISYKAERNIVDVIPRVKQLRLTLNLSFHELHDPRKLARDVSGVGHLGVGDIEVSVNETKEIPYIMGLIRQVFEKQINDTEFE